MSNNPICNLSPSEPWHFRLPANAAVRYAKQAIEAIDARMQAMNPIDNLIEMQYAQKYRAALVLALQAMSPIIRDMPPDSTVSPD